MESLSQLTNIILIVNLLLELEEQVVSSLQFLIKLLVWFYVSDVFGDNIINLLIVLMPLLCQLYLKTNNGTLYDMMLPGNNSRCHSISLESIQQGLLTLMAKDMGDILFQVFLVLDSQRFN